MQQAEKQTTILWFFKDAGRWIFPSSVSLKLLVIVCFAAVALLWCLDSALTRLSHPFPQSPWESQILTDAMLVMSLYSVALLAGLVGDCNSLLYRPVGYALTAIIGLLIVADLNAIPGALNWYKPGPRLGDANYHAVIKRVGALPGVVLCPDDPTIPLLAKGQLSRNFMVERDVRGQRSTPKYVLSQWERGDWIVLVSGTWTSRVPRETLQRLGYRPLNDPFFRGTSYSLWKRRANDRSN